MAYSNVTPPTLPDYSPVSGYSYNGVELPDINSVWTDKETYPYCLVYSGVSANVTTWRVVISTTPIGVKYSSTHDENRLYCISDSEILTAYIRSNGEFSWSTPSAYSYSADKDFTGADLLVWSSYDVVNTDDNSVYMAASDPIPIEPYPYSVIAYNYEKGQEDWYQAHLYYSATPFTYTEESGLIITGGHVTNAEGVTRKNIYTGEAWTGETVVEAAPEIAPGFANSETVYQRIYTDHDILDSTGAVWLAAGEVTPVEDTGVSDTWKYSFKLGLALGLCGKALPIARKLIGYSYNGTVLPKLPEWDKETYPYVFIVYNTDGEKYTLYLSKDRPTYGVYNAATNVNAIYLVGDSEMSSVLSGDSWGVFTEHNLSSVTIIENTRYAVWTNTDILDSDGATYLAASEPVPVYE